MSKSILIVDDEQEIAELLAMAFTSLGFKVDTAFSVNEAETKIEGGTQFDFVLSDIRMPRKDGVELLKWIQHRTGPKPVVLMMTGYSQYSEDQLKSYGAHCMFTKPLALDMVVEIISKI